jgi:hypothetical protein
MRKSTTIILRALLVKLYDNLETASLLLPHSTIFHAPLTLYNIEINSLYFQQQGKVRSKARLLI